MPPNAGHQAGRLLANGGRRSRASRPPDRCRIGLLAVRFQPGQGTIIARLPITEVSDKPARTSSAQRSLVLRTRCRIAPSGQSLRSARVTAFNVLRLNHGRQ
jgi:hypothetical protein